MKIDDLPVFTVVEVKDGAALVGSVSRWLWVGERFIAFLYLGDGQLLEGRFRNADEEFLHATFVPTDRERAAGVKAGESFPYFDGYWGERALLALDSSMQWEPVDFVPRNAVRSFPDGREETVAGGWDHEHCDICWATINVKTSTRHMLSSSNDRICCSCFERYVQRRSVDFISESAEPPRQQ